MGWNGSGQAKPDGRAFGKGASSKRGYGGVPSRATPRKNGAGGIVIGAIAAAIGGAALLFLNGRKQDVPAANGETAHPISTNVAHRVGEDKPKAVASHKASVSHGPPNATVVDVSSPTNPPLVEEKPRNVIVNDGSLRPKDPYAVVKLNSDKQIAALVYANPGQMVIGTVDFGDSFEEQFKESLKTRLVAPEDASEADRDVIATVDAARDAIVKSMKEEGKTAGEICAQTREQLRKFWEYREMLRSELRRLENDGEKTDEDVSDLFDAANTILKENEIEPFNPNDLTREVVRQHKFDQLESIQPEEGNRQ